MVPSSILLEVLRRWAVDNDALWWYGYYSDIWLAQLGFKV